MSKLQSLKRSFFNQDEQLIDCKKSSKHKKSHNHDKEKKHKHKENKSKKKKSKKRHRSSSSSSDSSDESDEWVEKKTEKNITIQEKKEPQSSSNRDDWMNMTGAFSTYTRADLKAEKNMETKKKANIDDYQPGLCSRELNPYWKDGGTGLPNEVKSKKLNFLKPNFDEKNHNNLNRLQSRDDRGDDSRRKKWKKRDESPKRSPERREESIPSTSATTNKEEPIAPSDFMTDEQMNALGAKIVKAEILGNQKLVEQLTKKLEAAREYKKLNPRDPSKSEDDGVVLTISDSHGRSKPLTKNSDSGDTRSKGGKKRTDTHVSGERMKYFADDDKYSLKQMFQNEKYSSTNDDEAQFANIISKHRNPNDDLEDIFAENITKNKSTAKTEAREKDKAIAQHLSIKKSLENCENCVESSRMVKHMIVSLGSLCYVALPTRKSLTEGHCIISTVMHTQCSTVVDEDSWSQIMDYRRALTNMFNSLDQDVVFFEMASYFNRHPHIVIHCVPLPREMGDMAPIYFKKALLECEAEWSNNKKVIDLKGKDIRRGVPKGLPYFWVDFGMSPGFAHVIEDQQLFPSNFAQEIIGGMLDLDHDLWRKPQRDSFETQKNKVLKFEKLWKSFDILKNQ